MKPAGMAWTLLGVGLLALAAEASAEPSGLSAAEQQALLARGRVSRPLRFANRGGQYVGGISYQLVRAAPRDVLTTLARIESMPSAFPATISATLVSSTGRSARVELVQGREPFTARYTILLEQTESGDAIRFWLDPSRPHDIRDVWGFIRVRPFGPRGSVVTVGAVLDLGPGIARTLFEDNIQRAILRTPTRIRDFIEPRALADLR